MSDKCPYCGETHGRGWRLVLRLAYLAGWLSTMVRLGWRKSWTGGSNE